MIYMNQHDIEDALAFHLKRGHDVKVQGMLVLMRLVNWTNSNSDGWPYWQKPKRAADKLVNLVFPGYTWADREAATDATPAELRKTFTPIKAFLTRQGVEHDVIFEGVTT